jgi:hypothetical protein
MSDKSYDGLGTNILTGAVIFSTFFLLVAVLASTGPSNPNASQIGSAPPAGTDVVTASHSGKVS